MNKPAPLSQRQYEYFLRCFDSWLNVAEGGKRGGKNVLATLIFCSLLETHKNKIHLVAGVSNATAKLNILDCDGYGLLNYFEGRCREGKYKDRDCVYVQTKTGEKVVLVSGGGKDGDEKLIKGNTYGMAYLTVHFPVPTVRYFTTSTRKRKNTGITRRSLNSTRNGRKRILIMDITTDISLWRIT